MSRSYTIQLPFEYTEALRPEIEHPFFNSFWQGVLHNARGPVFQIKTDLDAADVEVQEARVEVFTGFDFEQGECEKFLDWICPYVNAPNPMYVGYMLEGESQVPCLFFVHEGKYAEYVPDAEIEDAFLDVEEQDNTFVQNMGKRKAKFMDVVLNDLGLPKILYQAERRVLMAHESSATETVEIDCALV